MNTLVGLQGRLSTHGVKVSQVQLGRWAKPQPPARLSLKVLVGLCEALDCTLNDLLTITPVEAAVPADPVARVRKPQVAAVATDSEVAPTPAPSTHSTVGPTLRALSRHALAKGNS
ncbi:helix-turn-helix transcriptional regulator [Lysobacter arenosi]|uniref:Helix-turn-helix transcriptional regulator n=1 Tax=Lysobacter arenosi TaxID=2795387 RepID=A0ABX7RBV4_9GAMM|nr:helix-turn-helix transcriptional regulator [Lysobacter arenosi]